MDNKKEFNYKEIFDKLMEFPLSVAFTNPQRENFLKDTFNDCPGQFQYFINFIVAFELEKREVGKTDVISLMCDLATSAISIAGDAMYEYAKNFYGARKEDEDYKNAKCIYDELNPVKAFKGKDVNDIPLTIREFITERCRGGYKNTAIQEEVAKVFRLLIPITFIFPSSSP